MAMPFILIISFSYSRKKKGSLVRLTSSTFGHPREAPSDNAQIEHKNVFLLQKFVVVGLDESIVLTLFLISLTQLSFTFYSYLLVFTTNAVSFFANLEMVLDKVVCSSD